MCDAVNICSPINKDTINDLSKLRPGPQASHNFVLLSKNTAHYTATGCTKYVLAIVSEILQLFDVLQLIFR